MGQKNNSPISLAVLHRNSCMQARECTHFALTLLNPCIKVTGLLRYMVGLRLVSGFTRPLLQREAKITRIRSKMAITEKPQHMSL